MNIDIKFCIANENGDILVAETPDSQHELECLIEKAHNENLVLESSTLTIVTIIVKDDSHSILPFPATANSYGPEDVMEPIEEIEEVEELLDEEEYIVEETEVIPEEDDEE